MRPYSPRRIRPASSASRDGSSPSASTEAAGHSAVASTGVRAAPPGCGDVGDPPHAATTMTRPATGRRGTGHRMSEPIAEQAGKRPRVHRRVLGLAEVAEADVDPSLEQHRPASGRDLEPAPGDDTEIDVPDLLADVGGHVVELLLDARDEADLRAREQHRVRPALQLLLKEYGHLHGPGADRQAGAEVRRLEARRREQQLWLDRHRLSQLKCGEPADRRAEIGVRLEAARSPGVDRGADESPFPAKGSVLTARITGGFRDRTERHEYDCASLHDILRESWASEPWTRRGARDR